MSYYRVRTPRQDEITVEAAEIYPYDPDRIFAVGEHRVMRSIYPRIDTMQVEILECLGDGE